ncbi:hypothetical protein B0A52_08506 [Exophiala mesophila]|uniref:Clr5 domain-containing protein n=1 Tax=Exophiala mesophila TaxID=212818 RepID=A0A438MY93_EXOME|nr:hypothetical protein B0A52_08506 [Exophiala mesophila]
MVYHVQSPTIESLISIWTVAESIGQCLPAGDLISLSRSTVGLRTSLHGFGPIVVGDETSPAQPRDSLRIGHHNTAQWKLLKSNALWECSLTSHTKGDKPRPCLYCSRPVCGACIVKSSFSRGHENTFQNRIRHLCTKCWETGTQSRGHRFPLIASERPGSATKQWHDTTDSTRDYCVCTLKSDGHICPDCKDFQNWEAIADGNDKCHGLHCNEPLDDDKDRRRICLWCDKALPRQIGGTTRHSWNRRMVEARARTIASRQADIEEYNRKRLMLMRMSRREMRGDDAVQGDAEADTPQFVRHLDTMNYRTYMDEAVAPTPEAVYDSKRGYWRYNPGFLIKIGARVQRGNSFPGPSSTELACLEGQSTYRFARTNAEKAIEEEPHINGSSLSGDYRWIDMKAIILEHVLVNKVSYQELGRIMLEGYNVDASADDYRMMVDRWIWNTRKRSSGARSTGSPSRVLVDATTQASWVEELDCKSNKTILSPSDGQGQSRDPMDRSTPTFLMDVLPVSMSDQASNKQNMVSDAGGSGLEVVQSTTNDNDNDDTQTELDENHGIGPPDSFDPPEDDEDPPPYSSNGWLWP